MNDRGASSRYEFGGLILDPQGRALRRRDGQAVELTGKAFDALVYLAENPGRLVTRDELSKALWPRAVVEDSNLTDAISSLRRLLDNEAPGHRFVVTIAGRGYQFVAPVVKGSSDDAPEQAPTEEIAAARTTHLRLASFVVLGALAVAALAAAIWRALEPAPQPAPTAATLAVLPFKSLVAANRDESLELGMTETLIAGLHSDTLKVSSLSAVRRYAALEQDALAAGRELGVQAVLEGYIQRDDERLRVSTRLLNVADGRPLWSARFNEAFNDIFAVQDAVAAQVLAALTPDIVAGRGALRRYTNDPEAYEHYIAGRYYRAQPRTDVSLSQALAAFERAVARDPNFALAHAGIGEAHSVIGVFGLEAPDVAFPRAQRAVARALALAPDLGEIYAARGHIQAQYEFDWRGAQESFERAIRLAPNYAPAWQWRGILFGFSGRFDAALRDLRRAQQLEPASPTYSALIGMLLMYQRRYDEAIAQLTTTLQQDANLANANTYLTATYLRAGRFDAAAAQLERTRAAAPGSVGHYGQLLALTGRRDAARAEAQRLADLKRERYVSAYDIATIHATLGDSIRTLDWLERALEERAQLIAWLPWEPVFDGIRQEPRYRRLVARLDAAAVVREPGPTSETTPAAARSPR